MRKDGKDKVATNVFLIGNVPIKEKILAGTVFGILITYLGTLFLFQDKSMLKPESKSCMS